MMLGSLMTMAHAESVSWLEDGDSVVATDNGVVTKSVNGTTQPQVTLSTGQLVTLLGSVYVKAEDTHEVTAWALNNGYVATIDPYIDNAVHVEVDASQSIAVANQIAQLKGVITAAPRYQTKKVRK